MLQNLIKLRSVLVKKDEEQREARQETQVASSETQGALDKAKAAARKANDAAAIAPAPPGGA
jgi:hypothetical protein